MSQDELEAMRNAIREELKTGIQMNGCVLFPGDPSVDISGLAGIWADRDDISVESLRRKAWGYDRFDKQRKK